MERRMSAALRWCKAEALAAAAAITLGAAFAPSAQAGFFDFFFAPPSPSPAEQYAPYRGLRHHILPGTPGRGLSFSRERKRGAHRKLRLAAKEDQAVKPARPVGIMEDESLRKGDAVVTPAGIRIFVGAISSRHKPQDFKAPAEVKGLSKRVRKAFATLEAKPSGSGEPAPALAGRSASPAKPAGGIVTDENGRRIRYVGP
jgi:hypothetical protein